MKNKKRVNIKGMNVLNDIFYFLSCFICKYTMKLSKARNEKFIFLFCQIHLLNCKIIVRFRLLDIFFVIDF